MYDAVIYLSSLCSEIGCKTVTTPALNNSANLKQKREQGSVLKVEQEVEQGSRTRISKDQTGKPHHSPHISFDFILYDLIICLVLLDTYPSAELN